MLIMFRVKNFASFKDEMILDMRAVSYKDMKSHVIDLNNNKVVKTLAIYGKNASGKSNLVSALYCFESFIFNQFFNDDEREDDISNRNKMPNVRRNPYLLSEEQSKEIEFEMIFYHDGMTYQYGFSLEDLKEDNNRSNTIIKSEWLLIDDKDVFDRNGDTLSIGKKYSKELEKINKVREDRLYLGILDYFAEGEGKKIVDGFKTYLKNKFNVHFELIIEMSVKGIVSGLSISSRLIEDESYRRTIEQFIKVADIGIDKIIVRRRKDIDTTDEHNQYEIKTVHKVFDVEGNTIGEKEFNLEMESSGTIRYFSFIQYILNMMKNGGVFVVDEISARLHPVLTKFIIDLFQSEKNNKAQLIFTTHDISLMNRNQFRRDELAFVDKNEKGESSIYTLADIKARSDASFSKDYLFGKYGAIPIIKDDTIKERLMGDGIWED